MYHHVKMTACLWGPAHPEVLYESIYFSNGTQDAIDRATHLAKMLASDHQRKVEVEVKCMGCEVLTPALAALRNDLWYQYDDNDDRWM